MLQWYCAVDGIVEDDLGVMVDVNDGGDVDLMMRMLYLFERMIMMVVVIKLAVQILLMWLMKDTRP